MSRSHIRPWRRLSSRVVYENPWMTVQEDRVRLPNGRTTIYGVVTPTYNFVGVVPLLDDETVLLVRQYRYVQEEVTLEIPSGALRAKETPAQAAHRELREEAGYQAGDLILLSVMRSNKSVMHDMGHIFLAKRLSPSRAACDATEELEPLSISLRDALAMIDRHEITDCVSIIGLLLTQLQQNLK